MIADCDHDMFREIPHVREIPLSQGTVTMSQVPQREDIKASADGEIPIKSSR